MQSYRGDDDLHDFERPQRLVMRDEDLKRFLTDWGNLLLDMRQVPEDRILESLFRVQQNEE